MLFGSTPSLCRGATYANNSKFHDNETLVYSFVDVEDELKYDANEPISITAKHDLDRSLTALFIVCFYGNDEVVEKLLEKGIVNERKPLLSGRHALQVAATREHARCVELLCKFRSVFYDLFIF